MCCNLPDLDGNTHGTLRAVIQAMRKDLAVVDEGGEDMRRLIGRLVTKPERADSPPTSRAAG